MDVAPFKRGSIKMNAIVAANNDWGIGLYGTQAIVIPEDRQRFKKLTEGGVVIAGRKTFEQLPRLLPNRKNIILTRNRAYKASGAVIAHSINDVLMEITDYDPEKVFVIGGGEIYILFLPLCTYAYVTRIDIAPPSDTFFPDLDCQYNWMLVHRDIRTHEIPEKEFSSSTPCDEEYNRNMVRYSFDLYKNQDKSKRDN